MSEGINHDAATEFLDAALARTSAPPARVGVSFEDDEDGAGDERPTRVRARTISIKRLSKRELERGRMLFPIVDDPRPVTRGDCQHGPHAERPCPFVSCKHHLYLDVNDRTGSIKLNFPDLEVWDLPETCALDIADRGGITLEEVGVCMNWSRERVRQVETHATRKMKRFAELARLGEFLRPDIDVTLAHGTSEAP